MRQETLISWRRRYVIVSGAGGEEIYFREGFEDKFLPISEFKKRYPDIVEWHRSWMSPEEFRLLWGDA